MDFIQFIRNSRERDTASSLLILFGLFAIFFVVSQVLLAVVLIAFMAKGGDSYDFGNGLSALFDSPSGWWMLNILQGMASLLTFVGSGLVYWFAIEKKKWSNFNSTVSPASSVFLIVFILQLSFAPIISYVGSINENIQMPESLQWLETILKAWEQSAKELTDYLAGTHNFGQLLANIIVIGVIAGVGEELIFRGLVQRKLIRGLKNYHLAIWISAILFSAIHFQFYGFLPRMLLGLLFGYLYVWTGNIWIPIAAHIFNNSLAVILLHLVSVGKISSEIEKMDTIPFPVVVFATFVGVITTFYFYQKNSEQVRL